ncbi:MULTISPECIES: trypco2 family protein [unclassified Rhodococcus (in: high G+C Gram-positive bacteria)]|uniref:trypco2 family protein n=1 Tax=unclassified Rhodococcus (in: high G+C Gram-positive bacteria) TaxID=192944 RepID=UPI003FA6C65C
MKASPTLSEAIFDLRCQIENAQDSAAGQQLQFDVVEVELELSMVVTADGGLALASAFLPIGVDGRATREASHTVRLKLDLRDQAVDGERVRIADTTTRAFER